MEDRAFDILELVVWIYRITTDKNILSRGIGWATLQRWYNVKGSDDRNRIYAALRHLVSGEYLRPGAPVQFDWYLRIGSDYVVPTEKGFAFVERRQAPFLKKVWLEVGERRGAATAAISVAVYGVARGAEAVIRSFL